MIEPRLAWKDRWLRVLETKITSDTNGAILAPFLPDNEPTKLVTYWTGKQFTALFSALYTGAHLMFPEEAGEIIWQLLKVVHQPITLEDEEDNCINYPPSTPILIYEPQNPFSQPDLVPDGYLMAPFLVNTDFDYPELFGYLATDVMVPIGAIPVFSDWLEVLGLSWPTIKIRVNGQGQIELDLLSVAFGGYAIIKVGSPPNILDLIDGIIETGVVVVDLGQDLSAIPPESDLVVSEEINIDVSEPTDVYIVFVPKLDVSTEFFGFGGGIRQIGLCGFEEASMLGFVEDVRFNVDEMMLQQRKNGIYEDIIEWEFFINYVFDIEDEVNLIDARVINLEINDIDHYAVEAELDTRIDVIEAEQIVQNGRLDDLEAYDAANTTAITAITGDISALETRMTTAESDIDALDARLDLLEAKQLWSVHYDFKSGEHGFGGGSGVSWASTVGYSWSTSPIIIAKTDSSFLDGRIAFYRLELRKVGAGEQDYTVKVVGDIYSYGVAESGLNIRYHKLQSMSSREDLEIQFAAAGSWVLEGLTIFGYGDSNAFDD